MSVKPGQAQMAAVAVATLAAFLLLRDDGGQSQPGDAAPGSSPSSTPTVRLTPTSVLRGDGGPLLSATTGLALLVVGNGGMVEHVDLDTGRVTRPSLVMTGRLTVVDGAVVAADGFSLRVFRPSGPRRGVEIGPSGFVQRSSRPDHVWLFTQDEESGVQTAEEVSLDGDASGARLELPRHVSLVGFTRGDAVVNTPSGAMLLDPSDDASTPLEGTAVGVHGRILIRRHCSTQLVCATRIGTVDELGHPVGHSVERAFDGRWPGSPAFSPDGGTVALTVLTQTRNLELVLVDTATGEVLTTAPIPQSQSQVTLSNEWAFVPEPDSVRAIHRSGEPIFEIPADIGSVTAAVPVDRGTWP